MLLTGCNTKNTKNYCLQVLRDRQTDRQTETERHRETETDRDRETQRDIDTERGRDRQTDRNRDRERQTQTQRKTQTDRQTDRDRQRQRRDRDDFISYLSAERVVVLGTCAWRNDFQTRNVLELVFRRQDVFCFIKWSNPKAPIKGDSTEAVKPTALGSPVRRYCQLYNSSQASKMITPLRVRLVRARIRHELSEC